MTMDKSNILKIHTKTRKENNKLVKYFITNDSFEDEYGSLKSDYNAWRQEPRREAKRLTSSNYYNSIDDALRHIDFGTWIDCPTCKKPHYKYIKDKKEV